MKDIILRRSENINISAQMELFSFDSVSNRGPITIVRKEQRCFSALDRVAAHRHMYVFKHLSVTKGKGFIDLSAIDRIGKEGSDRFHLILWIFSTLFPYIVFGFFFPLRKDPKVPTFDRIYSGANWSERECWDMFGVVFIGSKDLRRILTDYGFTGFPLRKDFPVVGFLETRYDEESSQLRVDPVSLAQELRIYDMTKLV